tara:strand:- start:268 stop:567 length:300 start_codon:yes stop_codon:yes gene_type:complete
MENIDKGAKRKCTSCSTLFFDFGKFPIICPNCGATVSSLLTNVSKRGRPPKASKVEAVKPEQKDEVKIEEITAEDTLGSSVDDDDESVDEVIEIPKDED